MADESTNSGANAADQQPAAQQPVKMQILAQFIRDLSFENIVAQKGAPSGE